MAFTPDLPPGARPRMWILVTVTVIGGSIIYWTFGRLETLYIGGTVLFILLYLLLGVELTLSHDRKTLVPLVAETIDDLRASAAETFLLLLDRDGTVLYLSPYGEKTIQHESAVLTGQRFADLFAEGDTEERRVLMELLRFASLGHAWRGELCFVTQDGNPLKIEVEALPIAFEEARKMGFVALGLA
ncbi:MAG: PAS domain-containing protein [Myxococcota bacterium]|jgi:PAS domain-containing protein|nr:PAS domain-containing protein [Myxococcota bacterium]